MNADTELLLNHLKDHIEKTKNKPAPEPMCASQAVTILSDEEQYYTDQTQDIVAWRRLSTEERIHQRLSSTPLSQRISRIDQDAVRDYWESAIDVDLLREYLNYEQ